MICHFCENIFERNKKLGLPEKESIVYEDDNIYVMPDICPLSIGHMLIITKRHYRGYANADRNVLESVEKFLLYYEERISHRNYMMFEHGAIISYTAGASVDHAHIHILPFELDLNRLLESFFSNSQRCNLEELAVFADRNQPYLYCKLKSECKGYAYEVGKIESQFLRRETAGLIRERLDYDWKKTWQKEESYILFYKTLVWWRSLGYPGSFKWNKKLLLEKYGLVTYRELLNEVCRFRNNEKAFLLRILEKEIQNKREEYYRLILVPTEHEYKLPNYVVATERDFELIENFFDVQREYDEIWLFTGKKEEVDDSFSGRILYSWHGNKVSEIIEMVSGDNPRKLEEYTIQNEYMDYLRVSRLEGSMKYTVDSVHIGTKYKEIKEWEQCFIQLREKLEMYHSNLKLLCDTVEWYGIYSLSLDFKVKNGCIYFLDWDTSNDEIILKN